MKPKPALLPNQLIFAKYLAALGFQIHPPHQVLEARVVAEGVKCGPCIPPHDTWIAFVKAVLQQFNGPIFVAKQGVKPCFDLGL